MEGFLFYLATLSLCLIGSIAANVWVLMKRNTIKEKVTKLEKMGSCTKVEGGRIGGEKSRRTGRSKKSKSTSKSSKSSRSSSKSKKGKKEKKSKKDKKGNLASKKKSNESVSLKSTEEVSEVSKSEKTSSKEKLKEKKGSKSEKSEKLKGETEEECLPLVIPGKYPKIKRADSYVSSEAFQNALSEVIPFLQKYCTNPESFPVSSDITPGFLYNRLPTHPPAKGETFETLWKDFHKHILPYLTHWQHPRFLSGPSSGRSYPDTIAEMLAVSFGTPGFCWDASPASAELDALMVNWTGRAIGLPESFLFQGNTEVSPGGGGYMESVGDANVCTVMAVRTWKTNQILINQKAISPGEAYLFSPKTRNDMSTHHKVYGKLVFYASKDASRQWWKASHMGMVQLRTVASSLERDHGICIHSLERKIQKDISRGMIPCCLIATLGTPGLHASDNLREMGELAKKYNMWLHADASGNSGYWIDPKLRETKEDLWLAHSLTADMKMFAPTMVMVWTQHREAFKMVYHISAAYLAPSKSFPYETRDWGIHLCRRIRSLKMWIAFRNIGTKAMQKHLQKQISLCSLLESHLASHDNIKMFGKRRMASVAFQYYEPSMTSHEISKHSRRLAAYLNESHKMVVASTRVAGVSVIVVTVSYDGATVETITDIWKDMQALVEQYKQRKDDASLLRFALSPPVANSLDSQMSSRAGTSASCTGL